MKKRNPAEAEDDVIEFDESTDPSDLPLWYDQLLKLPSAKRKQIADNAFRLLQTAKPETFRFIKKFGCKLVGITPRVEYALLKESDGALDATYVHAYSMPTLIFWCDEGKFHFSVNANLDYNDTVLNRVKGNRRDKAIKGFTA